MAKTKICVLIMKRLIIGLVLVVTLAGIAFFMQQNQGSSTIREELSNFAFEDTGSVSRIIMKDESGEQVDLQKQPDGSWTVNSEYVARPDGIDILLTTMKKLSVKSPISQNAMETALKNIISNHVLVDIYTNGDTPDKSYYVGGANQLHTGTNMLMKNSTRPFVIHMEGFHGYLTPRFFTNELEWRDREVFGYRNEDIASLEINYQEKPEQHFRFENRGGGDMSLTAGPNLERSIGFDTLMLDAYLANYKMVHYESYEETKSDDFIDSVKASTPIFTITIETDDESRLVHGYRKPLRDGYDLEGNPIKHDQDRLYIWVDSGDLYVAQYAIFDKLTKGVYFFK